MRPTLQIKTTRPIRDRRAACACATLALALLVLLPAPLAGAKATTSTGTREVSSGKSTSMFVVIIAAGLLLGGIAFVIVRDARSVAPVVEGLAMGGTRNPEGRLRRRRAQAKAARRQRKRHRKR